MLEMRRSYSGLPLFILIISTSPMFGLGSVVQKNYIYKPYYYTWQEARRECQRSYSDLAFIQSEEDKGNINYVEHRSWISLTKETGQRTWMWSNGLQLLYFDNWAEGQPEESDSCASIHYSTKTFYGSSCDEYFFFYCEQARQFLFADRAKTWKEAKEFCLEHYEGLASLILVADLKAIINTGFPLWINTVNEITGQDFGDSVINIAQTEHPNWLESSDKCFTINTVSKTIAALNCSERFPFACMTDNVVLVKEKKSWEEAMHHCRVMVLSTDDNSSYDLVSVQAGIDDAHLRARASQADTEQVWVGLRFLGGTWFWIDGAPLSYPNLPQCPLPGKNCGVLSKKMVNLEMADCGEKRNFLCYSAIVFI